MRRAALLILIAAAPLAACNTVGGAEAGAGREVSAVVLDEGKRQEAAAAADVTKDAEAALAEVREGPSKAASAPN